jgi:hypothetical protein
MEPGFDNMDRIMFFHILRSEMSFEAPSNLYLVC